MLKINKDNYSTKRTKKKIHYTDATMTLTIKQY